MNIKMDIKSALAGLGAGLLIAFTIAASTSSGSPVGRYQVVMSGENSGGTQALIIDTVNGQVWKGCLPPNCGTDGGRLARSRVALLA